MDSTGLLLVAVVMVGLVALLAVLWLLRRRYALAPPAAERAAVGGEPLSPASETHQQTGDATITQSPLLTDHKTTEAATSAAAEPTSIGSGRTSGDKAAEGARSPGRFTADAARRAAVNGSRAVKEQTANAQEALSSGADAVKPPEAKYEAKPSETSPPRGVDVGSPPDGAATSASGGTVRNEDMSSPRRGRGISGADPPGAHASSAEHASKGKSTLSSRKHTPSISKGTPSSKRKRKSLSQPQGEVGSLTSPTLDKKQAGGRPTASLSRRRSSARSKSSRKSGRSDIKPEGAWSENVSPPAAWLDASVARDQSPSAGPTSDVIPRRHSSAVDSSPERAPLVALSPVVPNLDILSRELTPNLPASPDAPAGGNLPYQPPTPLVGNKDIFSRDPSPNMPASPAASAGGNLPILPPTPPVGNKDIFSRDPSPNMPASPAASAGGNLPILPPTPPVGNKDIFSRDPSPNMPASPAASAGGNLPILPPTPPVGNKDIFSRDPSPNMPASPAASAGGNLPILPPTPPVGNKDIFSRDPSPNMPASPASPVGGTLPYQPLKTPVANKDNSQDLSPNIPSSQTSHDADGERKVVSVPPPSAP
ncbi:WAS/WASL-interacting protein family member 1-like [Dermacentor albipictus]|uniref:WAS/WASL-interacting protein family member 1-like n=1 Tax=Dermacentor albipictus TaxID=60249 RepID=UPI0038FC4382